MSDLPRPGLPESTGERLARWSATLRASIVDRRTWRPPAEIPAVDGASRWDESGWRSRGIGEPWRRGLIRRLAAGLVGVVALVVGVALIATGVGRWQQRSVPSVEELIPMAVRPDASADDGLGEATAAASAGARASVTVGAAAGDDAESTIDAGTGLAAVVGASNAPAWPLAGSGVAAADILVHVAGEVRRPGLVVLMADARVQHALDAAGGPTPEADLDRINLAAPLADGQRVYLVAVGEPDPPVVGVDVPPAVGLLGPVVPGTETADSTGATGQTALVDINVASAAALETLPGVGPATAAAIIDHRERVGPFLIPEDLLDVSGIGPAKFDAVRDLIVVSPGRVVVARPDRAAEP